MAPRTALFPAHWDFTITRQSVFSDRCLRKKRRPYIFVDNFTQAHPNPYFNVARTRGRQSCKERLFFRTLLHSLCEANIEIGGGGWPPQLTHGHARTAFFSQTPECVCLPLDLGGWGVPCRNCLRICMDVFLSRPRLGRWSPPRSRRCSTT